MSSNLPTSPASRAGSPDTSVDAIFARLAAFYGKHWLDMWVGMPVPAVKAEWALRLDSMPAQAIRMAVDHLLRNSKFPPTLPEFYGLCDQFRPRQAPSLMLTNQKREPMPDSFKALLAKLKR